MSKPLSEMTSEEILAEHKPATHYRYYGRQLRIFNVDSVWNAPSEAAAKKAIEHILKRELNESDFQAITVYEGCVSKGYEILTEYPSFNWSELHPDKCPVIALARALEQEAASDEES